MQASADPAKPSQVFFGLIPGDILCLPRKIPAKISADVARDRDRDEDSTSALRRLSGDGEQQRHEPGEERG